MCLPTEQEFLYRITQKLHMHYIARDGDGRVMAYSVKPRRSNNRDRWVTEGLTYIDKIPIYADYDFIKNIKWEDLEPLNLDDII